MEEQLSAILGNPQLMEQIMNMAQSLSPPSAPAPQQAPQPPKSSLPDIDPAMVSSILSLAGQTRIDQQQEALLCALGPYLSPQRLQKLEKAMKAAKLAGAVSAILPDGVIPFLTGR